MPANGCRSSRVTDEKTVYMDLGYRPSAVKKWGHESRTVADRRKAIPADSPKNQLVPQASSVDERFATKRWNKSKRLNALSAWTKSVLFVAGRNGRFPAAGANGLNRRNFLFWKWLQSGNSIRHESTIAGRISYLLAVKVRTIVWLPIIVASRGGGWRQWIRNEASP